MGIRRASLGRWSKEQQTSGRSYESHLLKKNCQQLVLGWVSEECPSLVVVVVVVVLLVVVVTKPGCSLRLEFVHASEVSYLGWIPAVPGCMRRRS